MDTDALIPAPKPPSISHTLSKLLTVVVLKEKRFFTQAAFGLSRIQFKGETHNHKDLVRGEATSPLTEENLYHLGHVELECRDTKNNLPTLIYTHTYACR